MANKSQPAVLIPLPQFGLPEARFGKTDKVLKFPVARLVGADGWHVVKDDTMPEGVLFVGRDGSTFVADFTRYPANIKGFMVFHGSKQKIGDEYADLDTVEDCMEAAREMDDRLADGKWFADKQAFKGVSIVMRAIMMAYSVSEEEARNFLKPLSAQEKAALKASAELKPFVDQIEAERGKGIDTKSILSKLPSVQKELAAEKAAEEAA